MKKPKTIIITGQNLEENKNNPTLKFKNLRLKYLNKKLNLSFLKPNSTGHLLSFPHITINKEDSNKNKFYKGKYINHIFNRNRTNLVGSPTFNLNEKNVSNYLIINTSKQNISSNSEKKKISFIKYRHKKYVNHKPSFGMTLTERNEIDDNESMSKEKDEFNKYLKTFLYEKKKNNDDDSLFSNLQRTYKSTINRNKKKSRLFNMITFQTSTNIIKQKPIQKKSKLFKLKCQTLYKNKFNGWVKKNVIDMIEYQKPECYFSLLSNGKNEKEELSKLNICEKQRYKEIIEKLSTIKKHIEINPKNEYEIIKFFLLNNGIFDEDSLCIEKLDNFLKFIKKKKIEINPRETLKNNLINILYNNKYKNNKEKIKNCEKNNTIIMKGEGYLPIFIRDNNPKIINRINYRNSDKKNLDNSLKFSLTINNLKRIEK